METRCPGNSENDSRWLSYEFKGFVVDWNKKCRVCERPFFKYGREGVDHAVNATANFKAIAEREGNKNHDQQVQVLEATVR
jgi:hypothetical protein